MITMNKTSKTPPRITPYVKPKKSKQPKSKKAPKKARNRVPSNILELSPCAAKYAMAIANPWSNQAAGACIPVAPARASRKCTAFQRGLVTVGVGGFGFIAFAPTLCNDRASIWTSAGNYGGTNIHASMDGTAGVVPTPLTNLPYSRDYLIQENGAYFTTPIRGRVVSAAISVKYVGAELFRGGRVICYSTADHQNVNGYSVYELGNKTEADFSTPNYEREKCWIQTYSINDTELEFCESSPEADENTSKILRCYPYSLGLPTSSDPLDVDYGAPVLGVLIYGTSGNQFEYEIVEHVEYIGDAAEAAYTENSADPSGLAIVQSAASRSQRTRVSTGESFQKAFKRELIRVAKDVSKAALAKAGVMLLAAL